MDLVAAAPWVLGAGIVGLVALSDLDRYLAHRRDRQERPVPTADELATRAVPFGDRPALGKVRAERRSAAGAVLDALDRADALRAAAAERTLAEPPTEPLDDDRALGDPSDAPAPDERDLTDLPYPLTRVAAGDTAHAIDLTPEQTSTLVEDGTLAPPPGGALLLLCGSITTAPVTTRETGLPFCTGCTTAIEEGP